MKRLVLLILLIFPITLGSFARSKNILKIKLDNNEPLTISINGRRFDKHARELTIGDLPAGRHELKVYEYKAYTDGSGGNAKLLFSGTVKLRRNTATALTVHTGNGNVSVATKQLEDTRTDYANEDVIGNGDMMTLKAKVNSKETDTDKLKMLTSSLDKEHYNTTQLRTMMHWLGFEDSKLEFVKWAYANTTDKTNYSALKDEFSLSDTRNRFDDFLKTK